MKCKICGSENTVICFEGKLRDGQYGNYTKENYPVFECANCGTIWNLAQAENLADFYETGEYRLSLEGDTSIQAYYHHHDSEVLDKLKMTEIELFRDKIVADIGVGGGSFLDSVAGLAKQVIAVEPSITYSKSLREKGYIVFPYMEQAIEKYASKVQMITSWDVIEHVESPVNFLKEIFALLSEGGQSVVGTPTDYRALRDLLKTDFDEFIFSKQHPWIFSEKALQLMCEQAGFSKIRIAHHKWYGLGNFVAWLNEKRPCGNKSYPFITPAMDHVFRDEMRRMGNSDYLVAYLTK